MIDTTRDTLKGTTFLTLSTVCEEGSPWGTPVHFAYDDTQVYWFSFDTTVHSQNIARDPRVFITIFDSSQNPTTDGRTAVYIETVAQRLEGDEERQAQDIFADRIEDDRHLGEHAHFYSAAIGEVNTDLSKERRMYRKASA